MRGSRSILSSSHVKDAKVEKPLRDCAGGSAKSFVASDTAALFKAFNVLGLQLRPVKFAEVTSGRAT